MVHIKDIAQRDVHGRCEVSAAVACNQKGKPSRRAWFRFPSQFKPKRVSADPFVAGFLIPGMAAGEDLLIKGPLSSRLFKSLPDIQSKILGWYPHLIQIDVRCEDVLEGMYKDSGSQLKGIFFSGGADSLYSALTYPHALQWGIFIHGFENPVQDMGLLQTSRLVLNSLSAQLNMKMVEVHTNIRALADQNISPFKKKYPGNFFAECYLGSMLASAGLCLQDHFSSIVIPASLSSEDLKPYGSHPELDPLWSSESLDFIYHGVEATRFEKIRHIAGRSPQLLSRLQACEKNMPGEVNCCKCEKCLRTMMALSICGMLDTSGTFAVPFHPKSMIGKFNRKRWESEYRELHEASLKAGFAENAHVLNAVLSNKISILGTMDGCLRFLKKTVRDFLPSLRRFLLGKRFKKW